MKFSIHKRLTVRVGIVIYLFLTSAAIAFAKAEPKANNVHPKSTKIKSAFEVFLNQKELSGGQVGFRLLDGKTGQVILEHQPHLGMATASTLKTITSATAYHILGSDFKFKTILVYSGRIDENGILHGDLIIQGSGDPTLGSDRYENSKEELLLNVWTSAVKKAGIKHINGRIIGDDLLFGGMQTPGGWPWRDMGNYYGAGVSSLNWRENSFGAVFRAGSNVGDLTYLDSTTVKNLPFYLVNEVVTGRKGSGDNVFAYAAPYSNYYFLRGTHGSDLKKTIQFSTPDPALDLAYQLKNKLDNLDINQNGLPTTSYRMKIEAMQPLPAEATLKQLYVHESPRLDSIVYWFNRVSINLYGESLLKAIAHKQRLNTSSVEAAQSVIDFWHQKLGIEKAELGILDGSGLSPEIRVTAYALSEILASCQTEPWFGPYYESFPTINGIKMKSGTISGVLGYAGYHQDKSGNSYIFCFLVSNYEGGAQAMRNQMYRFLNVLK